jgi:hypothetical protein
MLRWSALVLALFLLAWDATAQTGTNARRRAGGGGGNGGGIDTAKYLGEIAMTSGWTDVPSVAVDVPDTCNYVLAFLKTDHQQYLDSVKLDGAHFDSIMTADHGWTVQVWGLKGPTTGSNTLYGYLDDPARLRFGLCYLMADTTDGILDRDYQQDGWGVLGNLTLTSEDKGIIVDFYGPNVPSATPHSSQTEEYHQGGEDDTHLLISTKLTTGASTAVYDTSSTSHWILGVAVTLTAE